MANGNSGLGLIIVAAGAALIGWGLLRKSTTGGGGDGSGGGGGPLPVADFVMVGDPTVSVISA